MSKILTNFRKYEVFSGTILNRTFSTIYALSSGAGRCGVGVIRVSGLQALHVLQSMAGLKSSPKARYAFLRNIRHPKTGEILDKGLALWFPGPKSFTGEDCCELQVHGSLAVINGVLSALGTIPNCRLAEPGEFTKRAFFNGKLDLTEVEGLSDLLQAETEVQRKQAFLQMQGSLSQVYNDWKQKLMSNCAHLEAFIDFEETEGLEMKELIHVRNNVEHIAKDIRQHLKDGKKGEVLRTGVKTVILGEPNVGKSSLFNLLCGRPAAIVTPIEGTTRDILEVRLDVAGYPVTLLDTAGLRTRTTDIIEKEGIKKALATYKSADLIVLLMDIKKYKTWYDKNYQSDYLSYVKLYLKDLGFENLEQTNIENIFNKPCLIIMNKIDLLQEPISHMGKEVIQISCKSKNGVENLIEALEIKLKEICSEPSKEHPCMNQARHRQHLEDCLEQIQLFLQQVRAESTSESYNIDVVCVAEYLRLALGHLGKLAGTVRNEQLLDIIFKDFCIGK